jgi:hypothetical protein
MQGNPAGDWQQLAEHYRGMYDEELLELASDFADLTEAAQQVLRNELRNRGLDEPGTACEAAKRPIPPAAPLWDTNDRPGSDDPESDAVGGDEESDLPHDYTWKTPLCECEDREHAWQIYEMLRRAGIESWIELPGSRYTWEVGGPQVMVPADQLDEAREIAAKPIPQEIVDQSKAGVQEFEAPKCPSCGAGDPVLEGVDPCNEWKCESCGKQWTESAAGLNG